MEILKLNNICKHYSGFDLCNVSFTLNSGNIMGFIGRNGAGKTTTLKAIMNIISIDSGSIQVFGKDLFSNVNDAKQEIGFVMNGIDFFPTVKVKNIAKTYSKFYKNWDSEKYNNYVKHFNLDQNKKYQEYSQGMKIKFLLSLALSHDAKLLILDEPTSGLDPISREEILDIFSNIIKNENRAILFSTHITSDLDKVADEITYIRKGEVVFTLPKAVLMEKYRVVEGKVSNFNDGLKDKFISFKVHDDILKGLIYAENINEFNKVGIKITDALIDDIIVYLEREAEPDEEFTL